MNKLEKFLVGLAPMVFAFALHVLGCLVVALVMFILSLFTPITFSWTFVIVDWMCLWFGITNVALYGSLHKGLLKDLNN